MSKVVLGVDWKSIISLVIFLACVLYARFVPNSFSHLLSRDLVQSGCFTDCTEALFADCCQVAKTHLLLFLLPLLRHLYSAQIQASSSQRC